MSFPPVFVINLDRDAERLAHMRAQLEGQGIPFERMPAVLGASLTPEEIKRVHPDNYFWLYRRFSTPGELGCTLSHWNVMREIVARGLDGAAIMEDDVTLAPDFANVLRAAPSLGYDVVKLEGLPWMGHYYQRKIGELGARALYLPRYPAVGAAAYYVSNKAAQIFLDVIVPVIEPVDHTVIDYARHDFTFAEVFPYPALQPRIVTANEQERIEKRKEKPSASYKWRKRAHKAARRWRQRLYEMRHLGVWTLFTPQEKSERSRAALDRAFNASKPT
ncbi:MAG: glycosyltransferase family 25 protein [Caulobacterales bacterium]